MSCKMAVFCSNSSLYWQYSWDCSGLLGVVMLRVLVPVEMSWSQNTGFSQSQLKIWYIVAGTCLCYCEQRIEAVGAWQFVFFREGNICSSYLCVYILSMQHIMYLWCTWLHSESHSCKAVKNKTPSSLRLPKWNENNLLHNITAVVESFSGCGREF